MLAPRSLRLNAAWSLLGNVAFFGVVFLVTPLAVHRLGEAGWGVWQLVGAVTIYAQLLNLSLGTAIHYQVALRTASGETERLGTVVTNVRLYLLGAGATLLLALALVGRPFVAAFVPEELQSVAWASLAISIVITAVDLQVRFYGSMLAGLQRMDVYGALQVASAAFLGVGVWLGFQLGMELRGFSAVMTVPPMLAGIGGAIAMRRLLPKGILQLGKPSLALFREMVAYSASSVLYTAGSVVLYQTMKLTAAARCGGPVAAGHMGLSISVAQVLSVVFTPGVGVLLSRVGQLQGSQRLAEVAPLLERTLVVLGLLLVPSVAFLWQSSAAIFTAWVGATDAASSVPELALTLRILLLGHAFFIFALPFYYAMLGVGEHRAFGLGMLVTAVLVSGVGVLAATRVPRIETLAAVYAVGMLCLSFGVTVPVAVRRFPIALARTFVRATLWPALACAPGVAAVAFRPRSGGSITSLLLDAAVFGIATLPGLELARRRLGIPLGLSALTPFRRTP